MSAVTFGEWNRTLLARQHLLSRVAEDAVEVLDRCVGLQSQHPKAAFFGLWSRISDFDPSELDMLLMERDVVRLASLRSTVFLMDTEDARWVRPLVQPVLDKEIRSVHTRKLHKLDPAHIVASARDVLTGTALSVRDLGAALTRVFPGEPTAVLTAIARCGLPLVQIPPRGLWRESAQVTYALFDDWAGGGEPAVTGREALCDLIRLYLRGFGPATVASIQMWSGLTGLRSVVESLERDWELTRLDGPDGLELFDLEGLDLVDENTDAPARLIAPYDNLVLAHADRRRVIDDDIYRKAIGTNGISPGFVLADGRVCGIWRLDDDRVNVEYFTDVSARLKKEVAAEVDMMHAFIGGR